MEEANRAVRALDLPSEVSEFLEQSWGISNLHPPQHEAMPSVLSGSTDMVHLSNGMQTMTLPSKR